MGRVYTKGVDLAELDRMGEYRPLWEGPNLNSNDTLPTNKQQYLSPNESTNDADNSTTNHQHTPVEEQDPIDI